MRHKNQSVHAKPNLYEHFFIMLFYLSFNGIITFAEFEHSSPDESLVAPHSITGLPSSSNISHGRSTLLTLCVPSSHLKLLFKTIGYSEGAQSLRPFLDSNSARPSASPEKTPSISLTTAINLLSDFEYQINGSSAINESSEGF